MPACTNPLWPCAMTGAVACLAGFTGLRVVIHGSSGCYYYPATLLHMPLSGTFILEQEVIFGSEERLKEVLNGLAGEPVAVVATCVPAVLGEDVKAMLAGHDVVYVDSPGFLGDIGKGYTLALESLHPAVNENLQAINIDGVCIFDPFARGNAREIVRLLALAGVPAGTIFSLDRREKVRQAAPFTIGTNGDFTGGAGAKLGGTLGYPSLRQTFAEIGERFPEADVDAVHKEADAQEERIVQACDKYLRRFDPPAAGIFAGASYAAFAADCLVRYLDAEIRFTAPRNALPGSTGDIVGDFVSARSLIDEHSPDLVIWSSFEQSLAPGSAFVGLIPPLRGRVRLARPCLAGIEGPLWFMEEILNASMDTRPATQH